MYLLSDAGEVKARRRRTFSSLLLPSCISLASHDLVLIPLLYFPDHHPFFVFSDVVVGDLAHVALASTSSRRSFCLERPVFTFRLLKLSPVLSEANPRLPPPLSSTSPNRNFPWISSGVGSDLFSVDNRSSLHPYHYSPTLAEILCRCSGAWICGITQRHAHIPLSRGVIHLRYNPPIALKTHRDGLPRRESLYWLISCLSSAHTPAGT